MKTRISKTLLCNAMLLAGLTAGLGLGTSYATAADTAAPDKETVTEKTEAVVSDSWITTKVKSAIMASSLSKGFHVGVKTKHGVVMLKGKLASQDAIDQVKAIAEKIKGVKSVDTSRLVVAAT